MIPYIWYFLCCPELERVSQKMGSSFGVSLIILRSALYRKMAAAYFIVFVFSAILFQIFDFWYNWLSFWLIGIEILILNILCFSIYYLNMKSKLDPRYLIIIFIIVLALGIYRNVLMCCFLYDIYLSEL